MTKEQIAQKLQEVLPHLRYAVKQAQAEGGEGATVGLGVMYVNKDKTGGKLVFTVDALSLIEDIAQLIDAPAYSEEDEANAMASALLRRLGLDKGAVR